MNIAGRTNKPGQCDTASVRYGARRTYLLDSNASLAPDPPKPCAALLSHTQTALVFDAARYCSALAMLGRGWSVA